MSCAEFATCFAASANRASVRRSGRPIAFTTDANLSGVTRRTNHVPSEALYTFKAAFAGTSDPPSMTPRPQKLPADVIYFWAKRVPPDLEPGENDDPKQVAVAYQAFRRSLQEGRKGERRGDKKR